MDYLLKFTSKAAADKALFTKETVLVDGVAETIMRPKYAAIDVIGTIYKPTGVMLKTAGGDVPEMVAVEGYHSNVRHTDNAPELDAFVVKVNSPSRGWAN
jgi:hypothetical protein